MADGHFPTLVSKDRDANVVANPIYVQLSDATNPVSFTGTSLNVNITGGASSGTEFAEDAAHSSGALGTIALVVRKDTIASNVSADGDYATLLQDANGRLYVQIHDGGNSITVDATDLDIRDLTHVSDSVKVGDGTDFLAIDASGNIGVTDAGGSLTVDGTVTVTATDLDIRDLTLAADAVKVSGNSTANGPTNPIYVQTVDIGILSNEVHNYNTASSIGSDATSNHDYTVAGTTFLLKQVIVSSSGGSKVEVQTGPVASLASIAVGFIPKEGGTLIIPIVPPREVPVTSTGTVRLIRTNRQGAAQDLYSTIMGNDVA